MSWRRILLWTTTSLLIFSVVAVALILTVDVGFLKARLETAISNASDREFSIDGDLSVRLGGRAHIVAHDVRLQGAEWSERSEMLRVGRLEAEVDLLSLLRGPVVIERIVVRDASVHVARNEANESNWALVEAGAVTGTGSDFDEREILLRRLDVEGVDISLMRPERPAPFQLRIASLHQHVDHNDVLSASVDATVNGRKLVASGTLDSWTALLESGRIGYTLEARLDRVLLKGEGFIDSLATPRRPELRFSLSGPSITDLYAMAGLGEHGAGNVNLKGSLEPGRVDGSLELRIAGNAGETQIDAVGILSDLQDLERASLKANASGPNLGRILGIFGILEVSEVPFSLSIDLERDGPQLTVRESTVDIGDAKAWVQGQLPEFPSLGNASVSARMEGPAIERLRRLVPIPDGLRGAFLAELELDAPAGKDEAYRARLRTTLGELSAAGTLGSAPEHFGSRASVRFAGENLAAIVAAWGMESPGSVPVTLSGDVEYRTDGIHLLDTVIVAGEHQANVGGVIGLGAGLRNSTLNLHLEGDSLADFGSIVYRTEGLPPEPYRVDANVDINEAGYLARDLTATVGDTNFTAEAFVARRNDMIGSRASVSIEGPSLERLVPELGTRRIRPGPFAFSGNVEITDGRLSFEQFRLQRDFANLAVDITAGWPLSFDHMSFDVRGDGRDVRALIGNIGPLQLAALPYDVSLVGSRKGSHWRVATLDATLGEAQARASGSVNYGKATTSSRLDVVAQIPGLAQLGKIDGKPIRDFAVTLAGRVVGHDGELAAESLTLTIDEEAVDGDVRFRPGPVPAVHIDLRSESVTLHPLQESTGDDEPVVRPGDGRVIPDRRVGLDLLASFNGTLRAKIGAFQRDSLSLRNVEVDATVNDGELRVSRFGFEGKSGHLDATARIGTESGTGRFAISVTARDFGLGLDPTNTNDFFVADIDARLSSSGDDIRAIAGNLDGFVFIDSERGRVRNYRALQAIYGDLLDEMLSTINPFYKPGEYTIFECVVLPIEINNGRMQSAPSYLVRTDKVQIMSQATVELDTEAIDVNIRTLPRRTLGISAAEMVNPYVKMVGTLGAPRLALDQKGALVAGGAAVATGGLSVLAKAAWDRFGKLSNDTDPCDDSAAAAKTALAKHLERS